MYEDRDSFSDVFIIGQVSIQHHLKVFTCSCIFRHENVLD